MLVSGQAVLDMAGQESARENVEGGNINESSPLCSCGKNLEHGYKTSIIVYGHQSRGEVMMDIRPVKTVSMGSQTILIISYSQYIVKNCMPHVRCELLCYLIIEFISKKILPPSEKTCHQNGQKGVYLELKYIQIHLLLFILMTSISGRREYIAANKHI